eukprot:366119-Chlamydomonas_euryale.AAC.39
MAADRLFCGSDALVAPTVAVNGEQLADAPAKLPSKSVKLSSRRLTIGSEADTLTLSSWLPTSCHPNSTFEAWK